MGVIETKYSVGDEVWSFGSEYAKKQMQCPDCLGTRKWSITFADGHSEECQCYTCTRGYEGPHGVIYYREWVPSVEKVIIKEMGFGSDGAEYRADVWYSDDHGQPHLTCRIFRDADLFSNEGQAQLAAQAEYERRMAHLADNNFPKKGDFAKAIERSTLGYSRQEAITHTEQMKQWLALLRPLQPKKKSLRQFDGDCKEKKTA